MTPAVTADRDDDGRDDERRRPTRPVATERSRTRLPRSGPDVPDGPDGPPATEADAERSVRARSEPMAVYALRDDDRYLVDTEGGRYVVDVGADTCTCPDHGIRGRRCKHLRRVGLEIGIGRVPAPGERVAACAVCGSGVFVPVGESGAFLCGDHRPRVGSFVRDREGGDLLVVVGVTTTRADEYRTRDGKAVSEYESNTEYGDHEPVVEAVYAGNAPWSPGPLDASDRRRYGFPASRLRRLSPSERPRTPVIGI